GVRARPLIDRPAFQLVVPVFDAGRVGGEKLRIFHRTAASPDAIRTAEIGDAAGRRYAGAAEDEDALRAAQMFDETSVGHASIYHPRAPASRPARADGERLR